MRPAHLHSFPTRRSSDLTRRPGLAFRAEWIDALLVATGRKVRFKALKAAPHGIVFGRRSFGHLRTKGLKTKEDRKSTRLNSSHVKTSYAVFGLKKKTYRT